MEEVRSMDRPRADSLHLPEDAGPVVPRLRPGAAGTGDDVVRLVPEGPRELLGARLEPALDLKQQLGQALQLGEDPLEVVELAAVRAQGEREDQRLQVEGFRGGVVLGNCTTTPSMTKS